MGLKNIEDLTYEDVLREFVEDIEAAYSHRDQYGQRQPTSVHDIVYTLARRSRWSDLAETYQHAKTVLANPKLQQPPRNDLRTWKCPDCARTEEVSYNWLADNGGPVCGTCDVDMLLQPREGE